MFLLIEKIIRENERIRFEQFGGSTKKQIEDTIYKLLEEMYRKKQREMER